ncbi:ABC transporter permease [Sphaerimonospora sp. CA-214678]|uniref:ABC transporter permease n=1 Tax=Sphaerimonospora sp. CA-214678 TaxID=3240029 RepID=UPI003D8BBC4C
MSAVAQRLALAGLTVALWELGARWLDARAVPPVAPVLEALRATVPTSAFWTALGGTLQSWALGMLIASAAGISLGLMVGASTVATRMTGGLVDFLRTVPAIMLVPLAVLVFGATSEMKVFLIALAATWPILVQSAYGIGHVDAVARASVQVFRLSRRQRVVFLYLPSALPLVATGLRVAATVALLISIGAEIVTSAPGIGHEILLSQANGNPARGFVYVLLSGCLGVLVNQTFAAVERRAIFWHAAQRRRDAA